MDPLLHVDTVNMYLCKWITPTLHIHTQETDMHTYISTQMKAYLQGRRSGGQGGHSVFPNTCFGKNLRVTWILKSCEPKKKKKKKRRKLLFKGIVWSQITFSFSWQFWTPTSPLISPLRKLAVTPPHFRLMPTTLTCITYMCIYAFKT